MTPPLRLTAELIELLRSDKSLAEISALTGIPKRTVCNHRLALGIRERRIISWPSNPEWYRVRTVGDMRKELGVSSATIVQYLKRNGFEYCEGRWTRSLLTGERTGKNPHKGFTYRWPDDPAWYAKRTARQVASYLGCTPKVVRTHCARRGITLRRNNASPNWPKDRTWYAQRTADEIALAMGVMVQVAHTYLRRNRILYKRKYVIHHPWSHS